MQSPTDRAYQNFANAIVKQAADDYRKALNGKGYNGRKPEKVIKEIEQFFHSRYFEILTRADGDYIIEKLKQEHEEKERSKHESNIDTSDTQSD